MINRFKAPVMAVAAAFVMSGCNLLDVDNPNSLVEESIQQLAAANGVANGAQRLVSAAIADVWEGPAVTSDELYWIGSRDAWGQLDQGFISNPENEFTDAAFPTLGRGVWMAQNAVEILQGHYNDGNTQVEKDLGRALMFRGTILMVTAEQQSDMTFSYKMTDGPPVSSGSAAIGNPELSPISVSSMDAVMGVAISSLSDAIDIFAGLGETDLELTATALRARAHHSRVIIGSMSSEGGAEDFGPAVADAAEVLLGANGVFGTDWTYNLSYSSASAGCGMCGNVNDRKENQIDLSLVTVDASNDVNGINLQDPIDNVDDVALIRALNQWKGGSYLDAGDAFPDLTVVNERLMHLILAEDALAAGVTADFEAHINHIRDNLDGSTPFVSGGVGMPTDVDMLQHARRVNTVLMGLRLQDMYRWGLVPETATGSAGSAVWAPASDAVQRPGSLLPITIIEVRANCHLNGQGCG